MRALRDYVNNPGLGLHFKVLILMASAETLLLSKMVSFTGSPGLDVAVFWGRHFSAYHIYTFIFTLTL